MSSGFHYSSKANIKNYLVNTTAINTNGDSEIQVSEASSFTGTIICSSQNISDLTGIEAFTALTYLDCYNNQLTSLDVSSNIALITLWCNNNQLTSLDVSGNTQLINLIANNNQLECLNVKNGNNTNFITTNTTGFHSHNNPNLTCIEVDDINYSTNNWVNIVDPQVSFSIDCNNSCSGCATTPSTNVITACNSYTWLDGNNYTASNNTATFTTINAAGCDSIIALDLTINSSSQSSFIVEGLDSYTAPSGDVYTTGGAYTDTIPNAAGCDSIITIDLSLNYTGIGELNNHLNN